MEVTKSLVVNGYVDASFDTDPDDSKSQTGYVFILNGGAVSWCSSKQSVVGSTCEAEYIAASEAANEGVWMKEFISDLGVIPSASGSNENLCDNTGAIALAKESRFHKRPSTSRDASIPSRIKSSGRHRDLQDTYGSECCRPID